MTGEIVSNQAGTVSDLLAVMRTMPQYQPETEHVFHGGMYCRKVFRHAGVTIVGRVHKKEHFYVVLSGTVVVTNERGELATYGPGSVLCSKPGTRRAVYAVTDAVCATFHRVDADNATDAETELVEPEADGMFDALNNPKPHGALLK